MTREYPPEIYGGAGVHVDYLSRELAKPIPVEVRTFGDQAIELYSHVPVEVHAGPEFEPRDPARFSRDLAAHLNVLLQDEHRRCAMGVKGRQRAEARFSWRSVAERVLALYESLVEPERDER